MPIEVTNSTFLSTVLGELKPGTHGWVCQFRQDPHGAEPAVWAGRAYKGLPAQAGVIDKAASDNTYFCTAVLQATDDFAIVRRKEAYHRLAVLLADDAELDPLIGRSTYVLETSPGKHQAGIAIEPDDPDAQNAQLVDKLMTALADRGLVKLDKAGNNRVRYGRLPVGRNLKAGAGNWQVRVVEWNPDHVLSLEDAAAVLGVDLDDLRTQAAVSASAYKPNPALRSLAGFPEGQRNQGVYNYACSLRARNFSDAEARVLVLHQAAACTPPMPEAEALGCLKSAWTRAPGKSEAFRKAPPVDPETGEIAQPQVRTLKCFNASSLPPASNTEVFDDELVEGVVGKAAMAVLYGDSNSGKTFLAIDLCAAIAQGAEWLGRHTERGVVLYLATESPASVKMRLRAYQRHHRVQLDWFYVVASPISLFNAQADMDAVMETVHRVEQETGQPVSLIVGDTLARLSAGANENSGEDMGVVLQNCDRIRDASGATFLLIHHTGKDAAKGMRGWSGMRAHIDTEVEVTADEATGQRCAEITKQRDLDGKGDRYGFTLEGVTVGVNKWGRQRTSCVVLAAEAPARKGKALKMGPAQQAVLDKLLAIPAGIKRSELVRVLQDDTRTASSIHNAIRRMGERGIVLEAAGMVALHGEYRKALSHHRMTGIHG